MKRLSIGASLLALILTFAGLATAKEHKRSMTLGEKASIGQQVLKEGTYMVEFSDNGNQLIVKRDDGKEVARATFQMEPLTNSPERSAIELAAGPNGLDQVTKLEFRGYPFALIVNQS